MTYFEMRNEDRGESLGTHIRLADRWWPRLRGLIGHAKLQSGEGLLIRPCQGVHMQWMKYPLDIAFLDPDGRVLAIYHALQPWRFSKTHRGATAALELPAGTLEATGTMLGDLVSWQEAESAAA